ncbi:HpcH/HpaI aldolase/citrate lyase family protein [Deinococcus maricopensis]|uniref:HpcH/HpaI aldolase n=1 Tax=Deinococcus maricopensis (strain DSM 21211 / LMG 22137 / NRRL B-23946 / LB-34) TaxID=709986 RepID=E8U9R3_DEIML|nr:HpcH/HpaI aldolase/citrate lyase family protein [Deinococcus maricopensis]ADV67802.1 HpcH/HpaI aldolase [Deinococcus maricopensis DSM 21211]
MLNFPFALGASLYIPATRDDLTDLVSGAKPLGARSLILCTEDAVREEDLPLALARLQEALPHLPAPGSGPLMFVRPRTPRVLEQILGMRGAQHLTGFVLPKIHAGNAHESLTLLRGTGQHAMVTVETREAFSARAMETLRDALLESDVGVPCVRVGGNDLLGLLGMRRTRGVTAYHTPLGPLIDRLVSLFKPWGLNVSAPVYDFTDDPETLAREAHEDLLHGTFGKTAIHPRQVSVIEAAYRVSASEMDMAHAILRDDAPAVFRIGDAMCEPSTHAAWARAVLARGAAYGVTGSPISVPLDSIAL